MTDRIEDRARFDFVRYANCWEDADVLCDALAPAAGGRILSVASGGDNSFALLAAGATVVAADLSAAQIAVCELKRAAFMLLDHGALLGFLGVRPSGERPATYRRLRGRLSDAAAEFWDGRADQIAAGIVHAGKFERYFQRFGARVMPLIHRRELIERMLAEPDAGRRAALYASQWDSLRWRMLFRLFFSRRVMGRHGRDPAFFQYVEGSVADRILARARHALTVLPTAANPFLQYILRGNFCPALPRYLRPEHFDAVRRGLDRLTLFRGPIQEAARAHRGEGFDGFNLSDIFEYLDEPTCAEIYRELLDAARPGARLAYWNMLVPRGCPKQFADRVRPLEELAEGLSARDLAFFYSAFHVEEVR